MSLKQLRCSVALAYNRQRNHLAHFVSIESAPSDAIINAIILPERPEQRPKTDDELDAEAAEADEAAHGPHPKGKAKAKSAKAKAKGAPKARAKSGRAVGRGRGARHPPATFAPVAINSVSSQFLDSFEHYAVFSESSDLVMFASVKKQLSLDCIAFGGHPLLWLPSVKPTSRHVMKQLLIRKLRFKFTPGLLAFCLGTASCQRLSA